MAENQYGDEVLNCLQYVKDNEGKPALSFVFKAQHVQINGKDITWKNYDKPLRDEELQQLQRAAETAADAAADEMDWQDDMDELSKRLVCHFDAFIKKTLFAAILSKGIQPAKCYWFIQHEFGKDQGYHCHVLLGADGFKNTMGKWIRSALNTEWGRLLVSHCSTNLSPSERIKLREVIEQSNWVSVLTYKHQQTRKDYTKMVNFGEMIAVYFLSKKKAAQGNLFGYCLSSDNGFVTQFMRQTDRQLVSKLFLEEQRKPVQAIETPATQKKVQRVMTQKEMSIKYTISDLVSKRVVSPEDWMMNAPDSYIQFMAQPGGETLLKNTIDICTLTLSRTKSAFELISEKAEKTKLLTYSILESRSAKIFMGHGWNPIKVMHAMCCVLNRQGGKRNSILLHGPASTGKSIIAQAIAQAVGNVGCYNAANVNFPFNDCTNKNLIWVEEAGNFGVQVNQFKAICSGQTIRIDQKGKGSKQIEPTPVILTTNEDITKVRIGCEERPEHTQPIKDRLLNIHLVKKLSGDFGLIDTQEWPLICAWLVKHGYEPTMAVYVKKWGSVPDWSEDWSKPTLADINTGSPSLASQTPSQASTPYSHRSDQDEGVAFSPDASDVDFFLSQNAGLLTTDRTPEGAHGADPGWLQEEQSQQTTWSTIQAELEQIFEDTRQ